MLMKLILACYFLILKEIISTDQLQFLKQSTRVVPR